MYRQVLLTREARANIKRGVGEEGRQISRSGREEEDPGFLFFRIGVLEDGVLEGFGFSEEKEKRKQPR